MEQTSGRSRRWAFLLPVLMVVGMGSLLIAVQLPFVHDEGQTPHIHACNNRLKQISVALLNYADAHGALPPAYTTDAEGKPLHSWRTLILPWIGEEKLYASIDLTKPWDALANAEARRTPLSAYACPYTLGEGNRTTYLAAVTPGSCLQPGEGRSLEEITDRPSATVTVVEVDAEHAVPWMAPWDADEQLVMHIGSVTDPAHSAAFRAAAADGGIRELRADLTAAQRRALVSIAGNEDIALSELSLE